MYAKLAYRNIKRSIKDYGVYFVTLSMAIALMFSFLSLSFSKIILTLSENMSGLSSAILALSLIVTIIIAFTVSYATKFIITKRKKEFATYLLLGMERRYIRYMFCIENGLIGILAFVVGLLFGSLLSQIFTMVILNIFEKAYVLTISVSWDAVTVTLVCFMLMYGINMIKAGRVIHKQKIINLMYSDRWNESARIKNPLIHVLIIIAGVLLIGFSLWLLKVGVSSIDNKAFIFILAAIIGFIMGLIGIYNSLPCLFVWAGNNIDKWKYDNVNMVLLRQISAKINLYGKTMGVLAVLLALALIGMSLGMSLGIMYKVNIKAEAPFDIAVCFDAPLVRNFDEVTQYIENTIPIHDYVDYQLYGTDVLPDVPIIALSDYNRLREQTGLDGKNITENQFIIHCDTWVHLEKIKEALRVNNSIKLSGHVLSSDESLIFTEPFEQYRVNGSDGYALVLPNYIIPELTPLKSRLVITTMTEAPQSLRGDLHTFIRKEWQPQFLNYQADEKITMSVSVKSWSIANGLTALSILSFGSIYLSLIFMILVGTILALQQISMGEKGQYHFSVMRKMGVSDNVFQKLIFRELFVTFFIPLIIPVILLISIAIFTDRYFGQLILMENVIPHYTSITLLVFFIIYVIYFIATYVIYKRNIYCSI